jgi:hypothetical protein
MAEIDKLISKAREVANQGSSEFPKISGLMCWDAVAYCARLAGIISEGRWNQLKGAPGEIYATNFSRVPGPSLSTLSPGTMLGFFEDSGGHKKLIHAMIYLGNNEAAGNKNNCIGIGNSIGWEILNLNRLDWTPEGSITAPNTGGGGGKNRLLTLHSRAITELK